MRNSLTLCFFWEYTQEQIVLLQHMTKGSFCLGSTVFRYLTSPFFFCLPHFFVCDLAGTNGYESPNLVRPVIVVSFFLLTHRPSQGHLRTVLNHFISSWKRGEQQLVWFYWVCSPNYAL